MTLSTHQVHPSPATLALAQRLLSRNLTIAVAESLTGGALAGELASVPGISASLQGCIVAYQTPLKAMLLGVDQAHLTSKGAVDGETARAMAAGVRRALAHGREIDIGVSTTGVAGPSPQEGKAVGTVYVGIDTPFGSEVIPLDLACAIVPGDDVASRNSIRRAAVEAAIQAVGAFLEKLDASPKD